MKNYQKGLVIPFIIAIVAILAIIGGVFVYENERAEVSVVSGTNKVLQIKELGIEIPLSASIEDLTYTDYSGDVGFSSKSLVKMGGVDCSNDTDTLGYIFIRNTATTTVVAGNEVSAIKTIGDKNIFYSRSQNPCSLDENVLSFAYKQVLALQSALQNARLVNSFATTTVKSIVGGDKDIHGCIGSAGYSWCAVKNKCLRVWEEKCPATSTLPVSTSTPPKTCTPNWTCDWAPCVNGYQGMTAVDVNNCNIPNDGVGIACPALARECTSSGAPENSFCGGIAGIKCAVGLACKYDGTYPDAGGKCIK